MLVYPLLPKHWRTGVEQAKDVNSQKNSAPNSNPQKEKMKSKILSITEWAAWRDANPLPLKWAASNPTGFEP